MDLSQEISFTQSKKKEMKKQNIWENFSIKSKLLYDYMCNNLDNMFNEDNTIKYFEIYYYRLYWYQSEIDEIEEKYGLDIQKELTQWIKKEFKDGLLIEYKNWKAFRDHEMPTFLYLGYNKLFQYKNYYFQLVLQSGTLCDSLYYINNEPIINFELALYGWIDDKFDKLQPYNNVIVTSDSMMPDSDWNVKYCS
jgi:hypothetical protein